MIHSHMLVSRISRRVQKKMLLGACGPTPRSALAVGCGKWDRSDPHLCAQRALPELCPRSTMPSILARAVSGQKKIEDQAHTKYSDKGSCPLLHPTSLRVSCAC